MAFTGSLVFRINLVWLVLLSGVLGIAVSWKQSQVGVAAARALRSGGVRGRGVRRSS